MPAMVVSPSLRKTLLWPHRTKHNPENSMVVSLLGPFLFLSGPSLPIHTLTEPGPAFDHSKGESVLVFTSGLEFGKWKLSD